MEKMATLNGTVEIYNASGSYTLVTGEKIKIDIAGVKEFEETCPAGHVWAINVRVRIVENET